MQSGSSNQTESSSPGRRKRALQIALVAAIGLGIISFLPMMQSLSGPILLFWGPTQRVLTYAGGACWVIWMYERGAREANTPDARWVKAWGLALTASVGGFIGLSLGLYVQSLLRSWNKQAALNTLHMVSGLVGGITVTVTALIIGQNTAAQREVPAPPLSRRGARRAIFSLVLVNLVFVGTITIGLIETIENRHSPITSSSLTFWGIAAGIAVPSLVGGFGGGVANYIARHHRLPAGVIERGMLARSILRNDVWIMVGSLLGLLALQWVSSLSHAEVQLNTTRAVEAQTVVLEAVEGTKQRTIGRLWRARQ